MYWWVPLTRGLILTLFGVAMIAFGRDITLLTVIQFLGAYWMVDGVFDLFEGFVGQTEDRRILKIISALISMVAGFIVVSYPIISGFLASAYVIALLGLVAIIAGALNILARSGKKRSVMGIILGILYVIFGVTILLNPLTTQEIILALLPFWAILTGGLAIATGIKMRMQGG
jgi:uncharacterized membrane protein HdeD (DUF308 family)